GVSAGRPLHVSPTTCDRSDPMRATPFLTLVLAAVLPLACSPATDEITDGTASVSIELHIVPTGVQCLRLTASTGSRVQRQLCPVVAGQSTRLLVGGLPAGMVTFNGDAFDSA